MTHICVNKLTFNGSDNGLSPDRRHANIWTNAGILLIWPLGTNFSEISIGIQTFSFKKMHLKMSSGKWRPFCLGLNVLMLQTRVVLEPEYFGQTRPIHGCWWPGSWHRQVINIIGTDSAAWRTSSICAISLLKNIITGKWLFHGPKWIQHDTG